MRKAEEEREKRVKTTAKVDYEKAFNERQIKSGYAPAVKEEETKGMSGVAKGIALEKAAEVGLAFALGLGGDEEVSAVGTVHLDKDKDYIKFAKKVSEALYSGKSPFNLEKFFRELTRELPKHTKSPQIKSIADNLMMHFNEKVKEERNLDKNVKKKNTAVLRGGGAKGYDNNNNAAMIADVMGGTTGDQDEYGNEAGFKREEEAEFDFM